MFLLDTDTLIYSLKGNPSVVGNFRIHDKDPKAISVITYGELIYGAQKSERVSSNLAKVYRLRELFPVIDVSKWDRMKRLIAKWLPPARVCHPYPEVRFGVIT